MKENVIEILNRKINEMLMKKEEAKRNGDMVRVGTYQRMIEILTEIIKEIQDTL